MYQIMKYSVHVQFLDYTIFVQIIYNFFEYWFLIGTDNNYNTITKIGHNSGHTWPILLKIEL